MTRSKKPHDGTQPPWRAAVSYGVVGWWEKVLLTTGDAENDAWEIRYDEIDTGLRISSGRRSPLQCAFGNYIVLDVTGPDSS